jgi:aryl-alcohol dehydrogenase-like predicted oxidoreductase
VYSVLIHNADDLLVEGASAIVHALESLKSTGKVRKIGVSVYESAQVRAVLELFTPDIVQAPVNVLDQRLIADGTLAMLRSRGVEIHSRSVFLQGLLLMPLDEVPRYFDPIRPLLRRWHRRCREQTMSPSEAAFSFVKGLGEVDCCLVGVQSLAQFQQCLRDFSNANSFDSDSLSCDDPAFLNPSKWSRH